MDLGEGIALNEALRENLFMLLVSVRTRSKTTEEKRKKS